MRGQLARLACLSIFTFPALALSQAEPDSDQAIDLPESITRTMARNPRLTAYGLEIAAAEGRLLQAEFAPRPELDVALVDAFGTDDFRGLHSAEATMSLGWVLERGVRQRRVAAAAASLALSTADIEIVRLDAAAETARRFLDCLALQARLQLAAEGVALAEAAVAAVQRRVDASRARAAELARAEAELVRAELLHEDYEHELLSAYHRLSAQWGETEPEFARVAGALRSLPTLEPLEVLVARVEGNPDVARFMSEQRLHEAELELAEAQSRPSWRVSAGLRRIEASDDLALVGSITVPLRFGNRNQGNIAVARAELEQTALEANAVRVDVATELFVLYQRLLHDIQLPARLEGEVIPGFETALADTERAFELGRSSFLEFREVQSELLDVSSQLLEAYIDAHRLVIEIERLTGERVAVQ